MCCGLGGQVLLLKAFALCSYCCACFSVASGMHGVVEEIWDFLEITQSNLLLKAASLHRVLLDAHDHVDMTMSSWVLNVSNTSLDSLC